jgi:hypothetical protein
MEKISYGGWPNCYRLANDLVDLIVTADVGPRIIRFGFVDQHNLFKEYEDLLGQVGGDEFRIYGGHRFWHAPEAQPRTYYPDNVSVQVEKHPTFVRVIQPIETTTGIQKEIDISLSRDRAHVKVTHRLRNHSLWAVELAPWALSVMTPGGKVIIPLPPRGPHQDNLQPSSTMTLWAYTDMSDSRWTWGYKYVMLAQNPQIPHPQKIGMRVPDGWVAYAWREQLFVKRFQPIPGATYPDWGCMVETFTDKDMLEVETLGPTVRLDPGATVEHVEHWFLFKNVPTPQNDADVDRDILPNIRATDSTIS